MHQKQLLILGSIGYATLQLQPDWDIVALDVMIKNKLIQCGRLKGTLVYKLTSKGENVLRIMHTLLDL